MYNGCEVYCCRIIAVLAAVYLTAFLHSQRRVVMGALSAIGAVALVVATPMLTEGWHNWGEPPGQPSLPLGLRLAAMFVMLLALAAGWVWERRSVVPVLVVAGMSFALPWLQHATPDPYSKAPRMDYVPSVFAYALVAVVSVFLAWWGVRERSRALINYGVAVFAMTVFWFYFSSLMDKLGRSLGLIGLGVLFLAGGWLLERMRRRLMTQMHEEVSA